MNRNAGFTLVEVLVALMIVALALVAITASVTQMIDTGARMRLATYASWIAHNRIAEQRLSLQTVELGRSNGTVIYAGTEWEWETVVEETGVEDLYRIDVSVSLAESEHVIRTVTGFAGPAGLAGLANSLWLTGPGAAGPDGDLGGVQ